MASTVEEFWHDKFKRLKANDRQEEALQVACKHLFYPGACTHSLVILRKLYKQADEPDRGSLLRRSHRVAVISRFFSNGRIYKAVLPERFIGGESEQPLNNIEIAEHIIRSGLIRRVEAPYEEFGTLYLPNLLQTDVKRMRAVLGEPEQHRDPAETFEPVWLNAVEQYVNAERKRRVKERKQMEGRYEM
jgi:hypothetical protein